MFDTIKITILMLNSGAEVDSMPWTIIASAFWFGKDFESPLKVISMETGSNARSLCMIQVVTFMQANLFHNVLAVCFILFNSFSFLILPFASISLLYSVENDPAGKNLNNSFDRNALRHEIHLPRYFFHMRFIMFRLVLCTFHQTKCEIK